MAGSIEDKKFNKSAGVKKKTPPVKGLEIGMVTDLVDPEGDFRVKIILSGAPDNQESIFAKVSSFDAGNNRGAFFMPEIGDEVIVGFVNNDPGQPVVLGSLYSRKNQPPLMPGVENHQKGYLSRSKIKIIFDDDKKSITIETPAGNLFTMNEDENKIMLSDPSGNKISMHGGDIYIEAANSMTLKAGSTISILAQTIAVDANNVLKIESTNSSISSSGVLDIKGSIININ